jgi:hypothetical protein
VPESISPALIVAETQGLWIPERRFAASGMTGTDFFSSLLVLLCHKLACWQHGHRNSLLAKSLANLTRMVAIDEATWRSGLIGGSAGSITWG